MSPQRYAKLPVIDPSFSAATCIAFDLMSINLADLPALPRLLPALQVHRGFWSDSILLGSHCAPRTYHRTAAHFPLHLYPFTQHLAVQLCHQNAPPRQVPECNRR